MLLALVSATMNVTEMEMRHVTQLDIHRMITGDIGLIAQIRVGENSKLDLNLVVRILTTVYILIIIIKCLLNRYLICNVSSLCSRIIINLVQCSVGNGSVTVGTVSA